MTPPCLTKRVSEQMMKSWSHCDSHECDRARQNHKTKICLLLGCQAAWDSRWRSCLSAALLRVLQPAWFTVSRTNTHCYSATRTTTESCVKCTLNTVAFIAALPCSLDRSSLTHTHDTDWMPGSLCRDQSLLAYFYPITLYTPHHCFVLHRDNP